MKPSPNKNTSVFLDGDLSRAETQRRGEGIGRKERKDRKDWKCVRLGDVLYNITWCNTLHSSPAAIPVVSQGDDEQSLITTKYYYQPKQEVILFGDHTCKVKLIDSSCYLSGDGIKLLAPLSGKCNVRFVYHLACFLAQKIPQGYARHLASFKELYCYVPPYEEQYEIASALCSFDALIAALQSLISKYEAIKKATVKLLLKPRESCATVKLGDVADIFRGGSPRPIQDYITEDVNGINWIKIGDVATNAKFIEHTEERIKPSGVAMSRQVKAGDFLLSNSMSFGRPYILKIDGCIHDGWLAIQNYETTFDVDYLYYLLGSEFVFAQYLENAAGSSVKNLNKEIVSNIILPLIPLNEQRKIAVQISAIDNVLNDCRAQLAKAQSLKQGMMSYFFG